MTSYVMGDWFVYVVRCGDGTLYTGSTTDVKRRLSQHNSPNKGAKYTRFRRPVTLAYFERVLDRSTAQVLEAKIKQMTRKQKLRFLGQ